MLALPPEPTPGTPVRAADFAALRRYALSQTLRPGPGRRVNTGSGGMTLDFFNPELRRHWPLASATAAWPFKVYNTTINTPAVGETAAVHTPQVQVNGGDGFVATLNGFVATAGPSSPDSGTPNDAQTGSPLHWPQIPVTGNGVIYGYATPSTPGTASPMSGVYYDFDATLPAVDTTNPAVYFPFLLATITGYATDDSGNITFTVNNATNYGYTQLIYCLGAIQIY